MNKTTTVHTDVESRSVVDLRKEGVHRYAAHPSTELTVLCFGVSANEPLDLRIETDDKGFKIPDTDSDEWDELKDLAESPNVIFAAHNATFEHTMWNAKLVPFGMPPLTYDRMTCTMARAYAMGFPGDLDGCAMAMQIRERKDSAGHRLMLQMCKPRSYDEDDAPIWWDDLDRLLRLRAYCRQDVIVERAIDLRLRELSKDERRIWLMDQRMNERGVTLDIPVVTQLQDAIKGATAVSNIEVRRITNNDVSACTNVGQIIAWVNRQGLDRDPITSIAKPILLDLLEEDDLPPLVRQVLELRQETAKSSTAKLTKMLSIVCDDGRARGLLQYHGAHTGRWAGRHIQIQNLPRPFIKPGFIATLLDFAARHTGEEMAELLDLLFGKPITTISSMLRALIMASPGFDLMAGDYSAIEARMLAFVAGELWVLEVFMGDGLMYERNAADIYGLNYLDVGSESHERFVGKVGELALGFNGGWRAFVKMAANFRVKISKNEGEAAKVAWRGKRPNICNLWYNTERAAIKAMENPGKVFTVEGATVEIAYWFKGAVLWCRLPSGRLLSYPVPKLVQKETPWGEMRAAVSYRTVDGTTRQWTRVTTYGGKLVENYIQAMCRDLLAEALLNLDCEISDMVDDCYPIFSVHDEPVCEVVEDGGPSSAEFRDAMLLLPDWAKGLPVDANVWRGKRYRK